MTNSSHALACFLWAETDDDGLPWEQSTADISPQLIERVDSDWNAFRSQAEALGFDAEEHCARMLHPDCDGDAWNAAAHDFMLTRNGHGTGFWDSGRWLAPWGDKLTRLAHSFGEIHAYLSSDGDLILPY
jgi:hypothetical protein